MADETCQPSGLADHLADLARLALQFGRIDRTACYHADRQTRESDTDHTVMLTWIAPALADLLYPGLLDAALVAAFAAVHDAVEVHAGDTPTLRIDGAGLAGKAARERAAADRWREEFGQCLPWLPAMIDRYERQAEPEARWVRGVDKLLPKLVHAIDGCHGLREEGISVAELASVIERQRASLMAYVGEFAALMDLHAELGERAVALHAAGQVAGHG